MAKTTNQVAATTAGHRRRRPVKEAPMKRLPTLEWGMDADDVHATIEADYEDYCSSTDKQEVVPQESSETWRNYVYRTQFVRSKVPESEMDMSDFPSLASVASTAQEACLLSVQHDDLDSFLDLVDLESVVTADGWDVVSNTAGAASDVISLDANSPTHLSFRDALSYDKTVDGVPVPELMWINRKAPLYGRVEEKRKKAEEHAPLDDADDSIGAKQDARGGLVQYRYGREPKRKSKSRKK